MIVFRTATMDDLDDLVHFRILMQAEVNDILPQAVNDSYREKIKDYFQKAISAKKYVGVLAETDGKIIGSSGVCFYEKPPSISGGSGIYGYVTNVFTDPRFRGQGVGSGMVSKIIQISKETKADKIHLGATEDGIGMYKKCGFKEPRYQYLEF